MIVWFLLLPSTLFSAGWALAATAFPCYRSAGLGVAISNAACINGDNNTFCCGNDYTCLSNGLCEWETGSFWVGTCTDQSWLSSACPKFCSNIQGNPELSQCSISDETYCCGNSSCCDDGSSLSTGLILGAASTLGFITNNGLIPVTTSATTSSSSGSPSSTTTTSTSTTTASTTNTTPLSTTTTAAAATSTSPPSSESGSSFNGGAIAGGTVGGIVAVGGLILIWDLKRRQWQSAQGDINTINRRYPAELQAMPSNPQRSSSDFEMNPFSERS
ncbi:hypothetical protein V8E54_009966 [Elaphomyces granulatus]